MLGFVIVPKYSIHHYAQTAGITYDMNLEIIINITKGKKYIYEHMAIDKPCYIKIELCEFIIYNSDLVRYILEAFYIRGRKFWINRFPISVYHFLFNQFSKSL